MNKDSGFTLVELMIAIVVMGIILAMAVPNFRSFVLDNRLVTQANDFMTTLSIARSEAIKRGAQVTVCKSADGSNCTTANRWEQGWITFVDSDKDETVDAGETIIQVHEAMPSGNTLRGSADVDDYISYVGSGAAGESGDLILCDDRGYGDGSKPRAIIIGLAGRARAADANDSAATLNACP